MQPWKTHGVHYLPKTTKTLFSCCITWSICTTCQKGWSTTWIKIPTQLQSAMWSQEKWIVRWRQKQAVHVQIYSKEKDFSLQDSWISLSNKALVKIPKQLFIFVYHNNVYPVNAIQKRLQTTFSDYKQTKNHGTNVKEGEYRFYVGF